MDDQAKALAGLDKGRRRDNTKLSSDLHIHAVPSHITHMHACCPLTCTYIHTRPSHITHMHACTSSSSSSFLKIKFSSFLFFLVFPLSSLLLSWVFSWKYIGGRKERVHQSYWSAWTRWMQKSTSILVWLRWGPYLFPIGFHPPHSFIWLARLKRTRNEGGRKRN